MSKKTHLNIRVLWCSIGCLVGGLAMGDVQSFALPAIFVLVLLGLNGNIEWV